MSGTSTKRTRLLLPTMQGYQRGWLRSDLLAGITAGAVVIPQAMAYATIADLPVEIGLYTCIVPMLVYAALGGARAMSVSTTSTVATLTATTMVSAGIASSSSSPVDELVTLSVLVGVILIVARLLRLGSLIENINEATLIGIKVGLGLTVALGQAPKLLGADVEPTGRGFIRTAIATIEAIPNANVPTVILSAASILVLLALRRWAPVVPAQLLVVIVGILLGAFTGLAGMGVILVGPVPSGFPLPSLPPLDHVAALMPGALAIALMVFLETASVARTLRRSNEPQIDADRELLAAGVANVLGGIFHALPSAGGFSQSAVNLRAGARTQLSTIVTAALAILVALFISPVIADLPQATLAAVVVVAVAGLIDFRGMARLWRLSRREFWIALVTALIGLAAGLLPAVAAGVLITIGMVLRELNRPRFTVARAGSTLTVTLGASLYTANVFSTRRAIEREVEISDPPIDTLVIDAAAVLQTSVTVVDAFTDWDHELSSRGIRLVIVNLGGDALTLAAKTQWWRDLAADGRTLPPA